MEGGLAVRHPHDPLGCLIDALGQIADRGHRVRSELDRLEHAVLAVAGDDPGSGMRARGAHHTPRIRGSSITRTWTRMPRTSFIQTPPITFDDCRRPPTAARH